MLKKLIILIVLSIGSVFALNYSGIYEMAYTWQNFLYVFAVISILYILYLIFYKFFKIIMSLFMFILVLFIIYYVYHFITGNSLEIMPF